MPTPLFNPSSHLAFALAIVLFAFGWFVLLRLDDGGGNDLRRSIHRLFTNGGWLAVGLFVVCTCPLALLTGVYSLPTTLWRGPGFLLDRWRAKRRQRQDESMIARVERMLEKEARTAKGDGLQVPATD